MRAFDDNWSRTGIFPDGETLDVNSALDTGIAKARTVQVARNPFLTHYDVDSEITFKKRCMSKQEIMVHAQIGYRNFEKTRQAYAEIHDSITTKGGRVDRYGICLDWSMGYPASQRKGRPKGTGLILKDVEQYQHLTSAAPVAPHFGDFVLGMPAALENTVAALSAGSTAIGNIGQYFTFRLPDWNDDLASTQATVSALALCANQPVDILIHSNLDDGFAALFSDLSCALGAVLLEQYIVTDLMGCQIGHCFGHTFSDPVTRWAFQRALARIQKSPGTMIYGNTTSYGADIASNYAALASYLNIDIAALRYEHTGHAINPVPVTEALRIPDVNEIIDASLFANELIRRSEPVTTFINPDITDPVIDSLIDGAYTFFKNVMSAFENRGIDTNNAIEMLLGLKRVGARRLEILYGPGEPDDSIPNKRHPVVQTPVIQELDSAARSILDNLGAIAETISNAKLSICVATTDVHEYGKLVMESVLRGLNVTILDGGVSTDPDKLADFAVKSGAHAIALSTYNGVALSFTTKLTSHLKEQNASISVYIGGKLNQIPEDSNSSLPVDVSKEIENNGVTPCTTIEEMIRSIERKALT
ncbi:MAG: hypothetical protein HON65_10485 [Rhodospirillales bacterium]|jgi:methylmalonyl-CoA mutase cobalamin-binding subunit|nr:hypothetical protein [Rhodospirillales bacterium]